MSLGLLSYSMNTGELMNFIRGDLLKKFLEISYFNKPVIIYYSIEIITIKPNKV